MDQLNLDFNLDLEEESFSDTSFVSDNEVSTEPENEYKKNNQEFVYTVYLPQIDS